MQYRKDRLSKFDTEQDTLFYFCFVSFLTK